MTNKNISKSRNTTAKIRGKGEISTFHSSPISFHSKRKAAEAPNNERQITMYANCTKPALVAPSLY